MLIPGMLSSTWLHRFICWYCPFQKSYTCPSVEVTVKLSKLFRNDASPGKLPFSASSEPRLSTPIDAKATCSHFLKLAYIACTAFVACSCVIQNCSAGVCPCVGTSKKLFLQLLNKTIEESSRRLSLLLSRNVLLFAFIF